MSDVLHQIESMPFAPDEQARMDTFQATLASLQQSMLARKQDGSLPLLSLPYHSEDVDAIIDIAKTIRAKATGLLVFGTGGSSLGGKTLCALGDDDFPIHFIDNLDPHSLQQCLHRDDLATTHMLIISKSGGTLETLTQALVFLRAMEQMIGRDAMASRCHIITMPQESPLKTLAQHYAIPMLDHDPHIGGRYSVLSNVGLLPAAVAGVDIRAIREGAGRAMQALDQRCDAPSLQGAAWQAALMPTRPISVLMPYCDRLKLLGAWYQQLWAESLGKDGFGSTPVAALGAVDQHSQLQLYLDGPKDKVFTLITLAHGGNGPLIPEGMLDGYDYLKGKTIGDVFAALQHGTVETIKRHGLPLRVMQLEAMNAHSMGYLLMHFMLETIAAAELLGVNAFDQPAVEEGKQIARDILKNGFTHKAA